ncbi:hypothetical protein QBC45DRAFT_365998 [Copromyces sp. CBS 386.78]|nr:hypothetical protein QBC45DRAFT_365998 [Copromyces sp. CBS 386.78]
MEMESAVHRRIELQSPEDFTYLIDNVRRAAADSINAAFPPVDPSDGRNGGDENEEEDELRVRIEGLVNDYITKTFTLVALNISINGLPVNDPSEFLSLSSPLNSPSATTNGTSKKPAAKKSKSKVQKKTRKQKPQEEYEPFDTRKRTRLESLAREEEDLLRSIALLKRRVPSSAAASFADSFARQSATDKEALEKAKQKVIEEGVLAGRKALEGLLPLATDEHAGGDKGAQQGGGGGGNNNSQMERQEGIEDGFGKAVEALRRLKSQMPATVARMERARVAGGYVVAGVTGGAAPGEGR